MDLKKFTTESPGRLQPIDQPQGRSAFVPHPLPANCQFPSKLWPLLLEAMAKVSLLEGIGRTLPNSGLLLSPIESREAIQSSRIEGTYATPRELFLFELDPREPKPGENQVHDWLEVYNYRRALEYGTKSELPLSLRLIREIHRILMTAPRSKDKTPGVFRTIQVAIGSDLKFVPPPPLELPQCLHEFEQFLHAESGFQALVKCYLCHYQFETIHPFADGNGRVGRLLLAIMLQRECGLSKPWLYLSDYFERHRQQYCDLLFAVSASGAWHEWIEFCLLATRDHAEATIARCDKLRLLREEFSQRLQSHGGHIRLQRIVESLFHSPYVQVTEVRDRLNISYPTAKSDIERLCEAGILSVLADQTPLTYYSPEIYAAAYEDIEEASE